MMMRDSAKDEPGDAANSSSGNKKRINILLYSDDGRVVPVEIDEIEEVIAFMKRSTESAADEDGTIQGSSVLKTHSISDRIEKMRIGETLVELLKMEAMKRKETLRQLLDDHEQIVKVVNSIEPTTQD